MDEDPDQHSHPLFRQSPGQKDARSSRKRRNQTQPNTEREIPRKWRRNPKNQPSNRPKGRRRTGRRQTRQPGPKDQAPRLKQGTAQASRTGARPDLHRHHKPGRRKRGPKEPQSRSRSHARASASGNATPQYQDDSKYFTKKIRSDSTSATDPRDTPPTVARTRDRTLVPRHPEPEGEWRSTTSQRQNLGQTRTARTDKRCGAPSRPGILTATPG